MRTAAAAAAFAVLLAAAPVAAWAEGPVKVRAEVVLASSKGQEVQPPELERMRATFQKQGFGFTSFKRLSQDTLTVEDQKPAEVRLPNGVNATLSLVSLKDGVATLRVQVPRLSETDVELGRSGSVYQLAGDHVGGKLILVLSQPGK